MRLGSLFDGSGGFPLAGVLCGIEPSWAAEVEPYPIAVTSSRFPDMKHLGDISKVNGTEIEPVDIITFGSPCQDLSVAGKRAGGGKGPLVQTNLSATLQTSNDQYLFQPVYAIDKESWTSRRGIGYQNEIAPTLRADVTPAVVYDARGNGEGNTASTITGDHENRITDYTNVVVFDGANVTSPINASNPQLGDPCHTLSTDSRNLLVAQEPIYCLQGNGIDRADTARCNGKGWKEDASYTLNTIDRPAVAYAMQGFGDYKTCGVASGLKARDYKDATDLVVTRYIVRRLTPTECARLQGFADRWGDIEKKNSFTPEEYEFWLTVRNTHAAINGKAVKDYTETQMLTWYNKLHTDSAEYKMWGNGIALPPALYCMQGMAEVLIAAIEDDWML